VWYNWTAPYTGGVVVEATSPGFPDGAYFEEPIVSVYTGTSLASLVQLASDISSFGEARVAFSATAGQTYQIDVDGAATDFGPDEGDFQLTVNLTKTPANDQFVEATLIPGNYYTNSGSFLGATREPGEPSHNASNYPQTLWWTWTAPTNDGVASSAVSLTADAVSFPPAFGVYTGTSVSNLAPVALTQQASGMTTMAAFTANAGVTYQIALAGEEQNPAGNIISPRWGDYRFRLNNRALVLTVLAVTTSADADPNVDFDFTAELQIQNLGSAVTRPLRVYVSALSGVSVLGPDDGSASDGPAISLGVSYPTPIALSPGETNTVQFAASLPAPSGQPGDSVGIGYGAYAELQEQELGTNWVTVDQALVCFGDWPALNGNPGPGGGVIRLDPDYVGSSGFDPLQLPVLILGPPSVLGGESASYIGQARYASGATDSFTNTTWLSSLFSITNGWFQAGNVTSNTPVTLSALYEWAAETYTATLAIVVGNLPPPTLSVPSITTSGAVELTLGGLPGKSYVIEAATKLAPSTVWTAVVTNATGTNGLFDYTDPSPTHSTQRFYRARVSP
jgi:hypothetical protein